MKARFSILLAVFVAFCMLSSVVFAGGTEPDRLYPDTAYCSETGAQIYLVAYVVSGAVSSPSYSRANAHIAGQFVDSETSQPIGDPFAISENGAILSYLEKAAPAVAWVNQGGTSCGQFLVVWGEDSRSFKKTGSPHVWGQFVNANPAQGLVGGNFLISSGSSDNSAVAVVCNTDTNKLLVAWQHDNGADYDIWGQLVNHDATLFGASAPVADLASSNQSAPAVAYDYISENFLVVFEDNRGDYTEIYGQMMIESVGGITSTLTATDTNFIISNVATEADKVCPATAHDTCTERFVTVWQDYRNQYEVNSGVDIYGQLVNSDTTLYLTNFPVCDAPYDQMEPDVAMAPLGVAGVVWTDYRFDPNAGLIWPDGSIYGQTIDVSNPFTSTTELNYPISVFEGDANSPAVAYGGFNALVPFSIADSPYVIDWVLTSGAFLLENLDDHLVALWAFDDESGPVAADSSGNANDGIITGAEWVEEREGAQNHALYFDGASYVSVPDAPILDLNDTLSNTLTITAWIRPDGDYATGYRPIVAKTADAGNYSYFLGMYDGSPKFRISSDGLFDSVNDGELYVSGFNFEPDQWYHIAGAYDGSQMTLFINNLPVGSPEPYAGGVFSGTSPVTIGTCGATYFEGDIDDVHIYDMGLDAFGLSEVTEMTSLIRGWVANGGTEAGIPGALVEAKDQFDGPVWQASTDFDGYYQMFVPEGCYDVTVDATRGDPGLQLPPRQYLHALPATDGGSIADFTLSGGAITLAGVITDGMGAGIDAIVYYENKGLGIYYETWTDGEGNYELTNLPPVTATIGVLPEDNFFAATSVEIGLFANQERDFTLDEATQVKGVVVDEDGYGVAGVEVDYYQTGSSLRLCGETDASGQFIIDKVPQWEVGYVVAEPYLSTRFCHTPRYYTREDYINDCLGVDVIRLQQGAMVEGMVMDAEALEPLTCVNLIAGGFSYNAEATSCNGLYYMILPEGQHTISLNENPAELVSATPVTVTVTADDVLSSTAIVNAPDIYLITQDIGNSFDVMVEENPSWLQGDGELVAVAYPAGTFTNGLSPELFSRPPMVSRVMSTTLGVWDSLAPLEGGQSYDLYLTWSQTHPNGEESIIFLDREENVSLPLTNTVPITFTVPSRYNDRAWGGLYDENDNYVSGGIVYITDSGGNITGWTHANSEGAYIIYRVPEDTGYMVDGAHFQMGQAAQEGPCSANDSSIDFFSSLRVQNLDTPELSLIRSRRIYATQPVFDGTRPGGGYYDYQAVQELWLSAPYGSQMYISGLSVGARPGQVVENVQATVPFFCDGYWDSTDYLPEYVSGVCTPACSTICDDPYYEWTDEYLPGYDADTIGMGFYAVESAASTWAPSMVVTRTADVISDTGVFYQLVTVSARIISGTVFTGSLELGVFNSDTRIAEGYVEEDADAMDEYGLPIEDSYLESSDYFFRTITDPVVGHTYAYSKLVEVLPGSGVVNAVHHLPATRACLEKYDGEALHTVISDTLHVNEPGYMGQSVITPTSGVTWLPGFISKQTRTIVDHVVDVREINAARPQIIARSPAHGDTGIDVGGVISVTFDKSNTWNPYYFRLADQWGNLICDTRLGPEGWSETDWIETNVSMDTLVYEPSSTLKPGVAYFVMARAADETGYWSPWDVDPNDNVWCFATQPYAGDVDAPYVVSTLPYDGQAGVPTTTPSLFNHTHIIATFSETIAPMGTEYATMWNMDTKRKGTTIPISSKWMGNRFHIFPNAPLLGETNYRITLYTGISDLTGNPMDANYTWEFTTAAEDVTGPNLYMPLDGKTDVDVWNPSIIIYADEELAPVSLVMSDTISVYADGQDISHAFDVEYIKPAKGVRLDASPEYNWTNLPYDTVISVCVGAQLPLAVTDLSGNPAASAGQTVEFSFRTAPSNGNFIPHFYSIAQRSGPLYPCVYQTQNGVMFDVTAWIFDDYFDTRSGGERKRKESSAVDPNYGTVVTMTIGANAYGIDGFGNGQWRYQTNWWALPAGEPIDPGTYMLDITAYDTACHSVSLGHEVHIFEDIPTLGDPVSGTEFFTAPTVSWYPHPENSAGYYVQFSIDGFDSKAATFFVPDDGRVVSYTLDVPIDLDLGPSNQVVDWRVIAMANVGHPFEPWGAAVSERKTFIKGEDMDPPYILSADPDNGDNDAPPAGPWFVELIDDGSGVDPDTIELYVDGNPAEYDGTVDIITLTEPNIVEVWFEPDLPFAAGSSVLLEVYAEDLEGNPMPYPEQINFNIRPNHTITAPLVISGSLEIQSALDSCTSGDVISVTAGFYTGNIVVSYRHSGVALKGAGALSTTIMGAIGPVAPVLNLVDVEGFELSGFNISMGTEGVWIGGDSVNVLVARNIICTNYGDGIYIEADGINRIENNLIRYSYAASAGIHVNNSNPGDGYAPAPVIVNNTIVSNTLDGIWSENSAPEIYYNVVAQNQNYGVRSTGTAGGTPVLDYNCVWGNSGGNYLDVTAGANDITDDPMFVDSAADNYQLGPGSPAIDSIPQAEAEGGAVIAPVDDLLDRVRPVGNAYDRGCYEAEAIDMYFTSTPDEYVYEENLYAYEPVVVGSVVSYSLGGTYPDGMEIDQATGEVTYYPETDNDAGFYNVVVYAHDSCGRTVSQSYDLEVYAVNDPPEPPAAIGNPPYYAMATREFGLEFSFWDEENGTELDFYMQSGPDDMDFGFGSETLFWVPSPGDIGPHTFSVGVSDEEYNTVGEVLTVTVVPALDMAPDYASPLIMVTGAVTTTVAINCEISGGLAPYDVSVIDPTIGEIQNLDRQHGTFTFVPLNKGVTSVVVSDDPGFELVAGPFDVQRMEATLLVGDTPVTAGAAVSITVDFAQSDLDGLGFGFPAGSTTVPITVTLSQVITGTPYLLEGTSPIVQIGPDGTQFSIPASLIFPYVGGGNINDQLVFFYNAETSRWEYVPDDGNDGADIYVRLDHLTMFTLAEPGNYSTTLAGGEDSDDYRMFGFPAFAAAEDSIVELLGAPSNLDAYDDTIWRLFGFDAQAQWTQDPEQYYVEGNATGFGAAFSFEPGQVFWIISRYAKHVEVAGLATNNDADFYIILQPGWNMIGNPFSLPVIWANVKSTEDGANYYATSRELSPLYDQALFYYDPDDTEAGADGYVEAPQMEAYGGYWVQNPTDVPVTIRLSCVSRKYAAVRPDTNKPAALFARVTRSLSRLVKRVAWAVTGEDRPPAPPGAGGSNPGSGPNSIGTTEGGGGCFIETVSFKPDATAGWAAALIMSAFVLAMVVRRRTPN